MLAEERERADIVAYLKSFAEIVPKEFSTALMEIVSDIENGDAEGFAELPEIL
jgi:hypothetical protein